MPVGSSIHILEYLFLFLQSSHICHSTETRLQFLLLLQIMHNGIWKIIRFILRQRTHCRTELQCGIKNRFCLWPVRSCSHRLSRIIHTARVCSNQNCSVSGYFASPILQWQQKEIQGINPVFYRLLEIGRSLGNNYEKYSKIVISKQTEKNTPKGANLACPRN